MSKKSAIAGLLLLVFAPSAGVLAGMIIAPDKVIGKVIFLGSKIWIFLLPAVWHVFVDGRKLSLSPARNGGFLVSAGLGVLMSLFIVGGYLLFGKQLIDPQLIKDMAESTGLADLKVYLAGVAYWVLVNSVLEEYVWRWFAVSRCQRFMSNRMAILAAAFAFTIHHVIAMQVYFNWFVTAAASLGVFIGGVVWSWCYVRYRSIWPGYVSHAIVDVAVFAVGYHLIFQ